jgi:hypothetical protein
MIGRLTSLKVMVIAIPAMALTATGTASAATANLSARTQAHAHAGFSVQHGSDTSNASKAKGPDAAGPAKHGLCTAFAASAGHAKGHSVAFRNLQKAAFAAGRSITQFCAGVTPGKGAPDDTESTSSTGSTPAEHPDGHGKGGNGTPAGPPTSTPAGKPSHDTNHT